MSFSAAFFFISCMVPTPLFFMFVRGHFFSMSLTLPLQIYVAVTVSAGVFLVVFLVEKGDRVGACFKRRNIDI